MGNYLKQGVLFRGKTWLGMPEGNLFLFIQSVLVQQVTLIRTSASTGESESGSSTPLQIMIY